MFCEEALRPWAASSFPPCRGWFSHDCISSVVSVLAHCTQGGATMQPREDPRAPEGEGSYASSPSFSHVSKCQPFPPLTLAFLLVFLGKQFRENMLSCITLN